MKLHVKFDVIKKWMRQAMVKMFFKQNTNCRCAKPPFYYKDYEINIFGEDSTYGEISINKCKKCGTYWLKYLIDEPQYTKSGRWWWVEISKNQSESLTLEDVKDYIMSQDVCWVGGSFYEQGIHEIKKPIIIK
jgi:hypothetical protein